MTVDLEAVYARLPRMECRGLCAASCGPLLLDRAEFDVIQADAVDGQIPTVDSPDVPADLVLLQTDRKGRCPLLRFGRCTIYDDRPLICRLWGMVKAMRCPFGCEPERWVTNAEARELFQIIRRGDSEPCDASDASGRVSGRPDEEEGVLAPSDRAGGGAT